MLATLSTLTISFNGKSAIKLTWPGKQGTNSFLPIKVLFFTSIQKNTGGLTLQLTKRLNRLKSTIKQMETRNLIILIIWLRVTKFEELFLLTKNIDDTSIKSGE